MTVFILYAATSLDGYIARLDGRIDWLPSLETSEAVDSYTEFYRSVDALIMGSALLHEYLKPPYIKDRQLSFFIDKPL